jgi:hypothetical protein
MSSTQNKIFLERPSKHIARLLTASREIFIGNYTHKLLVLVVLYASKEAHLMKNTQT